MTGKQEMDFAEFEALIATFGADSGRWPPGRRAAAEALLASDRRARASLAEMQALERVLVTPPPVDAGRERALAERIVAIARSEAASRGAMDGVGAAGNVVRFDRRPSPSSGVVRSPPLPRRAAWQVGSLLAASLALGLALGSVGPLPGSVSSVFDPERDSALEQIVMAIGGDGFAATLDEDAL
ncbi:MAG TPA: hypothetical protein VFV47_10620 [Hyphomicrobiaceae bacterium]|nr:hypothetical protein [Hyphomicrobiaceae bacterium]